MKADGRGGVRPSVGEMSPAGRMARELASHLAEHGVESRISESDGVALVGMWAVGLNVWCQWSGREWRFLWSLDAPTEPGRWRYTSCPASSAETAARRIAGLYRERFEAMYPAAAARRGGGAAER